MDASVRTVIAGGAGTLTRHPDAIVAVGPAGGSSAAVRALRDTTGQAMAPRRAALEAAVGAAEGVGLIAQCTDGTVAVIGAGVHLRTEHVGHRLIRQGPCAVDLTDCTTVAVVPPTTPWWPAADAPLLEVGVRSGSGFWATLIPTAGAQGAVVEGVVCTCGAFQHPLTLRCRVCAAVVATPRPLTRQPRVPVCQLVLDDTRCLAVDGPVVIGREPDRAPEVQGGTAYPLVLTDTQRSVSRVHAVLEVDGWDLLLEERHSSNGVSVRPEDSGVWSRLDPGGRVRVLPGTDIALGRRTIKVVG